MIGRTGIVAALDLRHGLRRPLFWIWLLLMGLLDARALVIGLIITIPYLLANLVGAAIFRPEAEKTYRYVAYAIIGVSAIRGLPIWG